MIRAIHQFGPKPGDYVSGAETDIRVTFDRERNRLAKQRLLAVVTKVPAADVTDATLYIARDGAVFA